MAERGGGDGLGRVQFAYDVVAIDIRDGRDGFVSPNTYTEFDLRNEFDMSTLYRFIELLYTRRLKTIPMYP